MASLWINAVIHANGVYAEVAPDKAAAIAEALAETLEERDKGSRVLGWLGHFSRDGLRSAD